MDNQHTNNTGWIWLVGVFSVAALVLAWAAYNRAGENLSTEIQQQTEELAVDAEQTAETVWDETQATLVRAEARAELLAIQAELEAEANYAAAVAQVRDVRTDLRAAYENAEVAAQVEWRELDTELEQLEQALRANSADTLELLGGLILMLETDVRTDEM
ncbi:MAG TPA: hypothetical protein VKP88_03485 [Candidatus Paceibacterota bacterium]|nr:hypothetical protein [Candidatus Paceibacterota bacterium]